ncbi:hypothetical protein EZS27_026186 [termite gut metagenome]|uniref:Uncharacterized protein n=1 Tax=termite gut metagenome TaxID=433724 RepID=A0A5J4QTQ6_9ZZZZ
MTLTDQVVKNIIKRVIKSQDYRIEIVNLINVEFLQFTIDFFKKMLLQNLIPKILPLIGTENHLWTKNYLLMT